jgi:HAD superfamily hydrolase (TIGR01509 family)
MIKLIIFDLDGVLVDSKDIHFKALNKALEVVYPSCYINIDEHLGRYDGLSTKEKLKLLSKEKNLPINLHDKVWEYKQKFTIEFFEKLQPDIRIIETLSYLRKKYKLACCTNSIKQTTYIQLEKKGFINFFDKIYTNEDVDNPKPHAEIYMKCMLEAKVNPDETLILEDSFLGRRSALRSGAYLLPISTIEDVNLIKINNTIMKLSNSFKESKKWKSEKLNVLVPMAGAGSRFEKAGYTFPKPLIDVNGKPMIQVVVENLNIEAHYIFIVQKSHLEKYCLNQTLNLIAPRCSVVVVDGLTEGAACTTLLAKHLIDSDTPLLMANSDQFVEWNSDEFMYSMTTGDVDGGILTFTSTHPKWSFAKTDVNGFVVEVAEKNPISNIATVGIYFWKKGSDYVKYAEQMINNNVRVNNEFYVCPVFNEAIKDAKKIKTYNIEKMYGLGTPEDLNFFLKTLNENNIS